MTILIAAIILLGLILAIAYYAYCISFKAPARNEEEPYAMPVGAEYDVYAGEIKKCMTEMRARPFEEITITSHDGLKLYGRYYHVEDNAPIQIMCHGYKGSAFREFCGGSKLAIKMGHNSIIIDERSHGKSEGKTITFGIEERKDILSWAEYARKRFGDDIPVILCGMSMGAASVIMMNDQKLPENVKGIIADCPFSSPAGIIKKVGKEMGFPPELMYPFVKLGARLFGHFDLEEMDAIRAVKQSKVPILVFHGTNDRFVDHQMSEEIKAAGGDNVTLELFPDAGHALCYMVDAKRYEKAIEDLFEKILI